MVGLISAVGINASVAMQLYVTFFQPEKLAKGKLLTMPLRKWMVITGLRRKNIHLCLAGVIPGVTRYIVQILPVMLLWLGLLWLTPFDLTPEYSLYIIVLFVDDLFSDTEKWKKRWDMVKNKVKWKWLPAPMPKPLGAMGA